MPVRRGGRALHKANLDLTQNLVAQRKAVRHLLRVGLVKRFAKFAAVNFRVLPDLGFHFLWIVVPPLEMPGAKFSLGILLVAGALPGLAHLDLLFRWRSLGRGGRSRSGRRAELREAPGAVLQVMCLAVSSPRPFVGSPLLSTWMRFQDRFPRHSCLYLTRTIPAKPSATLVAQTSVCGFEFVSGWKLHRLAACAT